MENELDKAKFQAAFQAAFPSDLTQEEIELQSQLINAALQK